ncbi:MAG TPA: methyltransferase domain-containing protein [Acetobacteraceae bacterium]
MDVTWDYTELAAHYDKRADYSSTALDRLCAAAAIGPGSTVADIGAGTGKLAVPLGRRGIIVSAVEPNAAMRAFGIRNTTGLPVTWSEGTAEHTGLSAEAFELVTFGSSFNVVDQPRALTEAARILMPRRRFACMWNHRDLDDALQSEVEAIIRQQIPDYGYGSRREDPTPVIAACGLFGPVEAIEERFIVAVSATDYVQAWRSHGTLQRQAGVRFAAVIAQIERALESMDNLSIPYFTRIWHAGRAAAPTA